MQLRSADPVPQQSGYRVLLCVPTSQTMDWNAAFSRSDSCQVIGFSNNPGTLKAEVASLQPDVVVISHAVSGFSLEALAEVAHVEYPDGGAPAVLVVVPMSGELGRMAQDSGAAAVVHDVGPATPEVVIRAIPEAVRQGRELRRMPGWMARVPTAISTALAAAGQGREWQRGVLAIWSPKGGVGKTTIAANTAAMLGMIAGRRVLAADINANGGHLDLHTFRAPLKDGSGLLYLANRFHALGQMTVDDILRSCVQVQKFPLYVLPGLVSLEQASSPALVGEQGERFVRTLIGESKRYFDFVVIDCGSNPNIAIHRAALQEADRIVLVVSPDVGALVDARNGVKVLNALGIPSDRFVLVVNLWSDEAGLTLKEILDSLQLPRAAQIPLEVHFPLTANRGVPYVIMYLNENDPLISRAVSALLNLGGVVYPPFEYIRAARGTAGRSGSPRIADRLRQLVAEAIGS